MVFYSTLAGVHSSPAGVHSSPAGVQSSPAGVPPCRFNETKQNSFSEVKVQSFPADDEKHTLQEQAFLPAARRRGERTEEHLPGLLTEEVSKALRCGHRVHGFFFHSCQCPFISCRRPAMQIWHACLKNDL